MTAEWSCRLRVLSKGYVRKEAVRIYMVGKEKHRSAVIQPIHYLPA